MLRLVDLGQAPARGAVRVLHVTSVLQSEPYFGRVWGQALPLKALLNPGFI